MITQEKYDQIFDNNENLLDGEYQVSLIIIGKGDCDIHTYRHITNMHPDVQNAIM